VQQAKAIVAEKVWLHPGMVGPIRTHGMRRTVFTKFIPLTLVIIFLLLYLNFRNLTTPLVVMLAILFGLIGGFCDLITY